MSSSITVVINAFNEELHIADCIASAKLLTDDILVVDTRSTDNTVGIAEELGAKVITFPYSRFVEVSREFSIRRATRDWVFLLDGDERMTDALAREIRQKIESSKHSYYKVPRATFFGKKQLKWGGWYPDMVIKLLKRKALINWPKQIHTAPKMKGEQGLCVEHLLHYSQPNLEHMVKRTVVYEDVESNLLLKAKTTVSSAVLARKFFGELWRRMGVHLGFLDGTHGIIESIYQAFSKTMTYIFLYEKNKKSSTL